MQLFDATLNDINGGSIRCYATHNSNFQFKKEDSSARLSELRKQEFELELDTDQPYREFQERMHVHRYQLTSLLRKLKGEGKRIHAYGASTKGNTILQFCGLDNSIIECAADRNPQKVGARTLGTNIPIISEEKSRRMKPDYYLVLPWHFRKEFVDREKEMLRQGVGMIFPLPEVEIVRGG
jgi:hypothetical protein